MQKDTHTIPMALSSPVSKHFAYHCGCSAQDNPLNRLLCDDPNIPHLQHYGHNAQPLCNCKTSSDWWLQDEKTSLVSYASPVVSLLQWQWMCSSDWVLTQLWGGFIKWGRHSLTDKWFFVSKQLNQFIRPNNINSINKMTNRVYVCLKMIQTTRNKHNFLLKNQRITNRPSTFFT